MTHRWHWRKWLPERHGQLGGACPKDHSATPFDDFKGCTPCLRAELAKADGQINRCVEQNKYLESTISRLREYAWHKVECPQHVVERAGVKCNCGYDALMAEVEGTK